MRMVRCAALALAAVALVAGAVYAQDEGATITFTDTKTVIYEGTGEARVEAQYPVTVGNFRITGVHFPSEANLDNVGLVIPFRGALDERMVNLDYRWGGTGALALICEVVDPEEPIGFRVRAHARARMFHSPGSWLELNLGRGPKDDRPIPAAEQNKRFTGEMHRWYVLSSMDEIYRTEDTDAERFTIMLDTGERGSWWIKSLELKAWPTRSME